MRSATVSRVAVVIGSLLLGAMVLAQVAYAVYDSTGTLSHSGYCVGYGYADSANLGQPWVGTIKTGGTGPCYRKQDSYIYFNNGSISNPPWTAYHAYDLGAGAGPEGVCDYAYGTHYFSWTGGDTGAPFGSSAAEDC